MYMFFTYIFLGDDMKKNIFIILISTLFIFILFYFYNLKEDIMNREYIDDDKNIHMEYPYFHNHSIDQYLNDYLNSVTSKSDNFYDSLFIDYDYEELKNELFLTIYIYKTNGNMVDVFSRQFEIDLGQSMVLGSKVVLETSLDFDFYQQKMIDSKKPMVAITFDDGPNHNTIKILDILEHYGSKATFFLLGSKITENEKTIQRMKKLGMEIGNHMYSHKLLTKMKKEKIQEEIKKVDDLVFDAISQYPTLIRPSYGSYNKKVKSVVDRPIIIWNIDTLDWKSHNSKRIYQHIIQNVDDGDIILMHDIYSATANAMEMVVPKLLDMGYQLVTVSELFYYKKIELEQGKVYSRANL